ncbi:MAG TPA: hypothetical protein VN764_04405, partial [Polyangiaceae bacterium]|nr:hypothetical protein [Polyangiaceae bacterium]
MGTSRLWVLASLISLGACSAEEHAPIDQNLGGNGPTTQHGTTSREETDTDTPTTDETDTDRPTDTDTEPAGDGDGDTSTQSAPPEVKVLSPEADALLNDAVNVTCRVTASDEADAYPLDVTSIVAQVLNAEGDVVMTQPVSAGAQALEYTTELFLDDLDPGRYEVGCAASDTGTSPAVGSATVDALLDRGPHIQALTPAADSALSGAGVHNFEFRIWPHELFDDDEDAVIEGDPMLLIDGEPFALSLKTGTEDVYWVEAVDFTDETVFNIPPQGSTHLVVQAANGRGVLAEIDYSVLVDNDAPAVVVQSPATDSVIGQEFQMQFVVTDEHSGINWDTFSVAFGEVASLSYEKTSGRWTLNGDTLTLRVVTNEVLDTADSKVTLSYQVTVGDKAGNVSQEAAAGVFNLDQRPPVLSLDPPTLRYRRLLPTVACSHAFDPVGAALSDGDFTGDQALFRALVFDRTNGEPDQIVRKFSKLDTTSVRLYFRPADTTLVVDRDGDGVCDDAKTEDALTKVFELRPVPLAGTPFYGSEDGDAVDPSMGSCPYADPPATVPPIQLCQGQLSDLTFVASQSYGSGAETALYAPLASPGLTCTGDTVE